MKRIASILLFLIYLVPAIGVSVTMHYCGGRLASASLRLRPESKVCPCGMKAVKRSCCKDKTVFIKLAADQSWIKVATPTFKNIEQKAALPVRSDRMPALTGTYQIHDTPYDPPPYSEGCRIFLRNRVVRI